MYKEKCTNCVQSELCNLKTQCYCLMQCTHTLQPIGIEMGCIETPYSNDAVGRAMTAKVQVAVSLNKFKSYIIVTSLQIA